MAKSSKPRKPRAPRDPALPPITRNRIDVTEFVRAVVEVAKNGGNLKTLSSKMGISYAAATTKYNSLKKKGVKLPDIKGGRISFDPVALNDMIRSLMAS